MEDRKRPGASDDAAPPPKRQAVTVNGTKPHQEDLPWKDDIEVRLRLCRGDYHLEPH
jgi:E3 ubiquitin-protein ligase BRE1